MNTAQAKSVYGRLLRHPLVIRRFSGPPGPNRPSVDTACLGHIKGVTANPLAGDIMQNEFRAIVNAETLRAAGFALPITTADKLVLDGRELAISFIDSATDWVGELQAYRLRVKG